jgi:hypothetical protein
MKDSRLTFDHARIEHEGHVWHVTAKLDPAKGTIQVSRIYGDVTQPEKFAEAISNFFHAEMLKLAIKKPSPAQTPHAFEATHVGSTTCGICGKYNTAKIHQAEEGAQA